MAKVKRGRVVRNLVVGAVAVSATLASSVAVAPSAHAWDWTKDRPKISNTRNGVVTIPVYTRVKVGKEMCVMSANIYMPSDLKRGEKIPAIISGHGFLGGKLNDSFAHLFMVRNHRYVVVAPDQLGFGLSTCKIGNGEPAYDGKSLQPLLDMLAGKPNVAYLDRNFKRPMAPIDFVKTDRKDHNGKAQRWDPRVGMFGFSYGGAAQWALATEDARVDAIAPSASFTDMPADLFPADVPKAVWTAGLLAAGQVNWYAGQAEKASAGQFRPFDPMSCYAGHPEACAETWNAFMRGWPSRHLKQQMWNASPLHNAARIKTPTLLSVGQKDSLFWFNNAKRMYDALRRNGTPVNLIWQSTGHDAYDFSEYDIKRPSDDQYYFKRLNSFFDKYLKDKDVNVGGSFSYNRPWVKGSTSQKYDHWKSPKAPFTQTYWLDSERRLNTVRPKKGVRPDLWWGFFGVPTSYRSPDGRALIQDMKGPETNIPGTYRIFMTDAYKRPFRVVGMPHLSLDIDANKEIGPADVGDVVIFAKVYDIAPDGTKTLVNDLATPIRIKDSRKRAEVDLAGIVHEFKPGHRLGLMISGGDVNYIGGKNLGQAVIDTAKGQRLDLPVVVR